MNNWELTAYESQRQPQNIYIDNTESSVTARSLHRELMCPICLGILKKTMTTKECLHRFCADCIITALRNGNKECPTCRKKLVSKRSLRPDSNFDLLIARIHPNLEKYEEQHERVIAKLNISYMQALSENNKSNENNRSRTSNEINQSVNNTNNNDNKNTKKRKYFSISEHLSNFRQDDNSELNADMPKENDNIQLTAAVISNEIEIILKPYPLTLSGIKDEPRFMKTSANATVDHLRKYLIMRLNLNSNSSLLNESHNDVYETMNNINMYIATSPNNFIVLNGCETLQHLQDHFPNVNEPLNIYYSLLEVNTESQS